jgi:hypothetical protein
LATRVWAIADERLEDYAGPFVDWEVREEERRRELQMLRAEEAEKQRPVAKRRPPKPPDPARQRRKLEREVSAAEEMVEVAETAVAEIESELTDGGLYDGTSEGTLRADELGRELADAKRVLDEAMTKWSDAVEVLEEFDASAG